MSGLPDSPMAGNEPTLTFEEFRATGRIKLIADEPGIRYMGDDLRIEFITSEWLVETREKGSFYLQIANEQYISFDLNDLEHKLYDWAAANEYFKVPT